MVMLLFLCHYKIFKAVTKSRAKLKQQPNIRGECTIFSNMTHSSTLCTNDLARDILHLSALPVPMICSSAISAPNKKASQDVICIIVFLLLAISCKIRTNARFTLSENFLFTKLIK